MSSHWPLHTRSWDIKSLGSLQPSVKQFEWQSATTSFCFLTGKMGFVLSEVVGSLFLKSLDLVHKREKDGAWDWQVDWSSVCSGVVIELFGQGEEGAETKLLRLINLVWWPKEQDYMLTRIQAAEMSFLGRLARCGLGHRLRSRAATPPNPEDPAEEI